MNSDDEILKEINAELMERVKSEPSDMAYLQKVTAAHLVSNALAAMGLVTESHAKEISSKTGIALSSLVLMIAAAPRRPTTLFALTKISRALGCELGISIELKRTEAPIELKVLQPVGSLVMQSSIAQLHRVARGGFSISAVGTAKELAKKLSELVAGHHSKQGLESGHDETVLAHELTRLQSGGRSVSVLDLVKLAAANNLSFQVRAYNPPKFVIKRTRVQRGGPDHAAMLEKITKPKLRIYDATSLAKQNALDERLASIIGYSVIDASKVNRGIEAGPVSKKKYMKILGSLGKPKP